MTIDRHIAFIGSGNMASALIQGLLRSRVSRPDQLIASDVRADALAPLRDRHGIAVTQDNAAACAAPIVVLSVKPQAFPSLLPEIGPRLGPGSLVVSIAAGVPLAAIETHAPSARVIRAMPNTPALIGAGATALAVGSRASDDDFALARKIFESVGVVVEVPEALMDAVTALSGSGPAYQYFLAEALIDAGKKVGLSEQVATTLVLQTLYGAAQLMHGNTESPAELRRKVTSPGGTTHAGVSQLEARAVRAAFESCVVAARDRGRELGQEAFERLAPR